MPCDLNSLFTDRIITDKIKRKLPLLFHIAEEECKRDNKIGMEVGLMRERVIISMLMYFIGESRVSTEIPTTEAEKDVIVDGVPCSIKTITSTRAFNYSGVKASWTVDAAKAREFVRQYHPSCEIILTHISWSDTGALYYIPLHVQKDIFENLGYERFFKLPKPGTNPRGIEYDQQALRTMCEHDATKKTLIEWQKPEISVNVYKRWVDLWDQD